MEICILGLSCLEDKTWITYELMEEDESKLDNRDYVSSHSKCLHKGEYGGENFN